MTATLRLWGTLAYASDAIVKREVKEFAKRVIDQMHARLAAGYYDMPKPKPEDYQSHAEYAEREARKRNGGSRIPEDPKQRQAWAHELAIKNGWTVTRQPGEEA